MSPWRRRRLNQSMQARVAYSTSLTHPLGPGPHHHWRASASNVAGGGDVTPSPSMLERASLVIVSVAARPSR
jgi:hypothetical protein